MSILELKSIEKSFPGVKALDKVSLELERGEILGLIGENGAGKSTLIKVLAGVHKPDSGRIIYGGTEISIPNPSFAKKHGIGIIYQELNIIPGLTVQDNLFLGSESGLGLIKGENEKNKALEILDTLGANFKLSQYCRELSIAQQQLVEIAKSLLIDINVLVMDEPTASLTGHDVEHLFKVIKKLVSEGLSVIYVSHKLEEIEELADRVFIMRDGKHISTKDKNDFTRNQMIEEMVGRKLESEFPDSVSEPGETLLKVEHLSYKKIISDVSFLVKRGEIVGLAGLVGAGRTELVRLIAGAEEPTGGSIEINGKVAVIKCPADAMKEGIGHIPEDRKDQGLIIEQSVLENFSLINLRSHSSYGWVWNTKLEKKLGDYKKQLSIKYSSSLQKIKNLSGGNQQKVVIAKWLERSCDLFIFDEPTRGIDVGAKYEIYELMMMLLQKGKSILMVSSELPELLGISNRIIVMKEGHLVGQFDDLTDVSQEDIMQLCF
ncbi:MAG: sugar ABC transporter ATP-binding protein [Bacteroidetes bacterium]|nr:sugar ABC transporter ATP-binding protein [Bacteroidota bacterium]MDA1122075.1 sugar ABC transporter ATP-binding protein [Bacteroidota bacterium]